MKKRTVPSIIVMLAMMLITTACSGGQIEMSSEEVTLPIITMPDVQPTGTTESSSASSTKEIEPGTATAEVPDTESIITTEEIPLTEPIDEMIVRIESFRVVPGAGNTVNYNDACRLSLNASLEEIGCLPVFRVCSVEDYDLLCKLLPNDAEYEGAEYTILDQQAATYNQDFFAYNDLFAILYLGESSCFNEEHFQMDGIIRNQNLHLRVTFSYPSNSGKDFLCRCYWLFVAIAKSEVDSLFAYDATSSVREMPQDWTEEVNPDWRRMETVEEVDDTNESETEPLTTGESETTVVERAFHMVQTTYAVYDAARQKGLNEKLESAGSSPVFRLNSTADVSLFCALFKNDTELVHGIAPYNQEFFSDNVLFVIHMETGSSSNTEERFQVEKRIQNRVLHLRVSSTYPSGFVKGDMVCSWFFVPVDRETADSLIAYDATWTNDSLPPDWTEPVNPDWRTN